MIKKVKFVTIGYIEWRKGQDILIDAINGLSDKILCNCKFSLIGQDNSLMAQKLHEKILDKPYIEMLGTVERNMIHKILSEADVMICPSREDPMPTVCAEAMLHCVPCLVSDVTGTSAYIENGYNGLVFKNEDVKDLSNKICWCIEHRKELSKMGKRAYEIYEKNFSMQAFEQNLLKYVQEMI